VIDHIDDEHRDRRFMSCAVGCHARLNIAINVPEKLWQLACIMDISKEES
jgi:hypothetical protein